MTIQEHKDEFYRVKKWYEEQKRGNQKVTDMDILEVFYSYSHILTTQEIADYLHISNSTAYSRLKGLEEDRVVWSKKTSGPTVWAIHSPTWKAHYSPDIVDKMRVRFNG